VLARLNRLSRSARIRPFRTVDEGYRTAARGWACRLVSRILRIPGGGPVSSSTTAAHHEVLDSTGFKVIILSREGRRVKHLSHVPRETVDAETTDSGSGCLTRPALNPRPASTWTGRGSSVFFAYNRIRSSSPEGSPTEVR
jgi:hypothetical protein